MFEVRGTIICPSEYREHRHRYGCGEHKLAFQLTAAASFMFYTLCGEGLGLHRVQIVILHSPNTRLPDEEIVIGA